MVTQSVEFLWGAVPRFKLGFIRELAASGRLGEALELASGSPVPGSRSLGLATALAAVRDPGSSPGLDEQVRAAARELADELIERSVAPELDDLLAEILRNHGLDSRISVLVDALDTRTDLYAALGARSTLLTVAGRWETIRGLVRRVLADSRLTAPNTRARAMVLTAVASCRAELSPELSAAAEMLTEVATVAGALDLLADVVDIYARNGSVDAAAGLARSVPAGPTAKAADLLLSSRHF